MSWLVRLPRLSFLARAIAWFALLVAVALATTTPFANAQPTPPKTAATSTSAMASAEEEAADSPRASMRSFLDLCERGRFQEASIYLDLPKGSEKRAAELTSRLYTVLQQRLLISPEQLSPLAQGRANDGLATGIEELGKINDPKGRPVPIRLVRHESKSSDDEPRWVFAQSTVTHVDALFSALQDRWIRQHLPVVLLEQGPMFIYYWQWLALPVLAGLCLAIGRLLTFLSGLIARPLLAKYTWSPRLLPHLKAPFTLAWALIAFAFLLPYLALTVRGDELIDRGLAALSWLTFFWILLRVVAVVGEEISHAEWTHTRPTARSLASIGVRLGKVIVGALALMVALSQLGYPVTSVIAGLGIGGVALALAAQKTVENLFGSVSILADQPFVVGDTIRVDTIEGTVESIGLRSTRVRTADRTLIIFPNGKLADMRIESLGPRDRIRFATKLQIARTSSTTTQVKSIIVTIVEKLKAHASVRKEEVFVHLAAIGEASFDIEVAAPIETLDANEFAKIREELLIGCIDAVEKAGAKLAVPTRQVVTTPSQEPTAAKNGSGASVAEGGRA